VEVAFARHVKLEERFDRGLVSLATTGVTLARIQSDYGEGDTHVEVQA
jgi:hypothetical protein